MRTSEQPCVCVRLSDTRTVALLTEDAQLSPEPGDAATLRPSRYEGSDRRRNVHSFVTV